MNEPEPSGTSATRKHILLSSEEKEELQRILADKRIDPDLRIRARIVLDAGDGLHWTHTANELKISRARVHRWRGRFRSHGLPGITIKLANGRTPIKRLDHTLSRMPGDGAEATPADVKRAIVAFMAELPDDDPRSPHAPRAKVKLGALTLLARIASTEARSGNEKEADQTLHLLETLRDEADAIAEMPEREPPTLEEIVFDLAK